MVSYSPHVLAVHPSVPVSNVKELIAYAKANRASSISPLGTGGAPHSRVSNSRRVPAFSGLYPYKGGSAAVTDRGAGTPTCCSTHAATYPS